MENKLLVIIIVVAAAFFSLGGAFGILYKSIKDAPLSGKADTVQKLSSKLVVSMVVYGQVAKIESRNITLSFNGQQMTLNVGNNAKIYSLGSNPTASSQKTVAFGEIKTGDKLNIAVSLSPEGQLNVQSVIILPSVAAGK